MKARVFVTLKNGVLDPQGKAIEGALASLGIAGVGSVRQGKVFDLDVAAADDAEAGALLRRACERLLANTVIENYRFELSDAPAAAHAGDAGAVQDDPAGNHADDPTQLAADRAEMPIEGHP